jgi:hypothetical protein
MRIATFIVAAIVLMASVVARAADTRFGIVVTDETALRSAPRDSAKAYAVLWQGDAIEIRGEKMDYLHVYDHRLERGGFVSAKHVRALPADSPGADELLAVLRFLRETPGQEALGIGYAAAYIRAASPETLRGPKGADALDALGAFADRLARRASSGGVASKPAQAALSAHLEVAMHYGVVFTSFERDGKVTLCYEGDAFRRVLDSTAASASQRARAALGLTRLECAPGELRPAKRAAVDEARTTLLNAIDVSDLPPYLANRVHMRRAAIWNSVAFQRVRRGDTPREAAELAMNELALVAKADLTDEDRRVYADAAMRVNASRWATASPRTSPKDSGHVHLVAAAGQPGETCVYLVDAKNDAANALAKRCTYGIVWERSASLNREGNALAVGVQHTESWRELWVFRKAGGQWSVRILPPAATSPAVGYAELAGWIPGGRQMLVAREASGEGKYRRTYEVVRVDGLTIVGQAAEPSLLPAFERWQDPAWKQATLSLR